MTNSQYKPSNMEDPCAETGQACEYVSEDQFNDEGELVSWDLFCQNCFNFKNFDKEDFKNDSC